MIHRILLGFGRPQPVIVLLATPSGRTAELGIIARGGRWDVIYGSGMGDEVIDHVIFCSLTDLDTAWHVLEALVDTARKHLCEPSWDGFWEDPHELPAAA